ncbi:hypothetical protein GIB67_006140 [Kingdonia uniflora]|uniref:HSF-type DNA-binding domain-containing protein n=1 Tax=Kingdonia uniflora TaxID=39325 RepID=A0A7J7LQ25_9MAGN|nr:hypothetical protein GIB67_006140 [Kingdonia uniflora]
MAEEPSASKDAAIPPFLSKCYDMVEDPETDKTVSWSSNGGRSFVIWDMMSFQKELLPNYFKHSNFSSFMRQLNIYGFRKSGPDRWEFTNDAFVKGQKHLLGNINRRKNNQSVGKQKQPQQNNNSVGAYMEVGRFGLRDEVEILKRDRTVLMQELLKLSQHQRSSDTKLRCLRERLQGMEINQQQMLSLLAMAVQSPEFLAQLLQQNECNWRITKTSKKRSLPAPDEPETSNNQIVRYSPTINETSSTIESQKLDTGSNGMDDFFMNIDFPSFGDGASIPIDESLFSEYDGTFFLPGSPENGMLEKLLLDSHLAGDTDDTDDTNDTEPKSPEMLENAMETCETLNLITEQMGHLASKTNNT